MNRRRFLARAGQALLGGLASAGPLAAADAPPRAAQRARGMAQPADQPGAGTVPVTLFLCGDVMTGRGIDQILPHPSVPHLFEPYMRSALGYVELAERSVGPIPRSVDFGYIWGDARAELLRVRPDARIVNLETAVTTSEDAWPGKGIHYRMHPGNVPCLSAAQIDCCTLANNHVLDWGYRGLAETLDTLRAARIRTAGAGRDADEAAAPAVIALAGGRRVLVFAYALESSGVGAAWAASRDRAGVSFLRNLSARTAEEIARSVRAVKGEHDVVVASIHWGGNWGYEVPRAERAFAHALIDAAGVDVVHGHSSHHPKGIEVYRDKLILYGCGDFLNDYEGIGGYESFRADLTLMYFPTVDAVSGRLLHLGLTPMQVRRFRLNHAEDEDARWLETMLGREGGKLGTRVEREAGNRLALRWG
jgi:poly-gamma-glutamate synthesis protein (capsule biosynthesis protein)